MFHIDDDGVPGVLWFTVFLFLVVGVLALGLKVTSWIGLPRDEPGVHRAY